MFIHCDSNERRQQKWWRCWRLEVFDDVAGAAKMVEERKLRTRDKLRERDCLVVV